MNVHNTTDKPKIYQFNPIKFNKHDTIYQGIEGNPKESFITELVKIEKFQGFSNAYNVEHYFRIKDQSSWSKSRQITGLWKTTRKGTFYGDFKESACKTLLTFIIDPESHKLRVYEFPKGYYPNRDAIDKIISSL